MIPWQLEVLDAIVDDMLAAGGASGIDKIYRDVALGMLQRADKEEIQRFVNSGQPFPFSSRDRRLFWRAALEFAFVFLQTKDCAARLEFLVQAIPDILRTMPPEDQKAYLAGGRMLATRGKGLYECTQAVTL
jgi:hypothetical protein